MATPSKLPQTVSSGYMPTSTVFCFPSYQSCSVVSCIRTMVTLTDLPQTVCSSYSPTSTMFVFQATSHVQLSAVSGQWLHLQTCHRLSAVATHLLQLCLFSRLLVVFSCQLYQDNGYMVTYTYKPATDCLSNYTPTSTMFSRLPVVFGCQLPATDCLQ